MALFGYQFDIVYLAENTYNTRVQITDELLKEFVVYSLGERCRDETLALSEKVNFTIITPDSSYCSVNFGQGNKACTLDMQNAISYDAPNFTLLDICIQAGGKLYEQDSVWECNNNRYNGNRRVSRGKSYILNMPACIGISCNATDIKARYENRLFPRIEELMLTAPPGTSALDCSITSDLTSSSHSILFNQQHGSICVLPVMSMLVFILTLFW
jgi:hypothetical protein